MKTAAGVALGERYRLVRQIAVGGMGEVWEAHDDALARPVAVKVLRSEFAGDRGFLERFRTEARNSASLSHPNIAQLFDYGEQDGSGFLVMELVVGEPLSDLLEREPVLATRRLLPILAQTARGLHAAHIAGVVHRDVKPGNILLGRGGRVKITDFGVSLARNQVTMTATGMVMGTAQYLSPEQAVGHPATPLSDLYSLGIIAYEALVGHRPFTGPTAVDIAVAHVNNPVPALPASVDKPLVDLVMKLLSKEPARRPQSGEELAELLDRLVPRTPPSGVPMVVEQNPTRPPDAFATAATPTTPALPADRPPSYPPRRTRRLEEPAAPRRSHAAPPPPTADHRWFWPVLALVLVLVALLGAFAAKVLLNADGPPGGTATPTAVLVAGPPPGRADPRTITAGYSSAVGGDAMIGPYGRAQYRLTAPTMTGTASMEAEDA
ncbi:serine/threonine-protein kinase [Cellulomonas sp. URHD0024]|uniref:serine/threonine-protein kinase n=1 Tax=Cellulomonas sp. URHD0024 TaxID=1302620 RepID=UPI0004008A63|nr:serine/threonine-protein kinase [Cellulomonas sp. URHD0024]